MEAKLHKLRSLDDVEELANSLHPEPSKIDPELTRVANVYDHGEYTEIQAIFQTSGSRTSNMPGWESTRIFRITTEEWYAFETSLRGKKLGKMLEVI